MKKRITLAITGHRDMIERDELKQELNDYLDEIITHNSKSKIVLLSPLAEGADRFVAKLFLEKKEKHKNLQLIVPMPYERERYLKDFDQASTLEFLAMVKQAGRSFAVPHLSQSAYLDVGRYVVDNADILLALWDGTFNGKVGGTGDIVNYARTQNREVLHFLCERDAISLP